MSINYTGFAFPKPEKKEKEKITKIKGKKHKQTKETDISKEVQKAVWERDKHKCIICHKEVPIEYANAHYIARSHSGLGIEKNIVTLCIQCHNDYDNGNFREKYKKIIEQYLQQYYKNSWEREDLTYNKWKKYGKT